MTRFVTVSVTTAYFPSPARADRQPIVQPEKTRSLNVDHVVSIEPGLPGVRVVDGQEVLVGTTAILLSNGEKIIALGKHSTLYYEFSGIENDGSFWPVT